MKLKSLSESKGFSLQGKQNKKLNHSYYRCWSSVLIAGVSLQESHDPHSYYVPKYYRGVLILKSLFYVQIICRFSLDR